MSGIDLFVRLFHENGVDEKVVQVFKHYYNMYMNGEKGKLSKEEICTPDAEQIIDYNGLDDVESSCLNKLAVIKLNGGLGTSMGLSKAKSLLPVKEDDTFLDIIAKQTLRLREKYGVQLPLIFMNSFNTSEDTLEFLKKYKELKLSEFPLDFLQNMFPKVRKDDAKPLETAVKAQNWNPPGHGDIYTALSSSGLLKSLLEQGFEYVFVSNSDNLGAIVDPKILKKLIDDDIDFAMEVCIRTEMDKKGGHLAKTQDGCLILREVAQCPDDEIDEFQDIERYKYFNTNSLWIKLSAIQKKLDENEGVLPLPLILNEKKVDDIPVIQFETAMGSAISLFDKSRAICVPRNRFLPVKKNQDLLLLWSDCYELNKDFILRKRAGAKDTVLDLDNEYYGKIDGLMKACERGVPSLYECDSFKIMGFVRFKANDVFKGKVFLQADDSI